MTNATKTLALVFAGCVALALASTWGGGGASSAAFQGRLVDVDTSAVQAVRIERPGTPSVRLARADSGWAVAPGDTSTTYPASQQAVRNLLGTLPALEASAVTTRQSSEHPRYGVDSTGTTVTMLGAGDAPLGRLIVGRTRMQRPQSRGQGQNPMRRMRQGTPVTYVRRPDRPDVYAVEQALGSVVDRDVDGWRDKQIWAVPRSRIQRIDFTFPADSSFVLRRAAPDTAGGTSPDTWVTASDSVSGTDVAPILRTLSSPEADGFIESATPDTFGSAPYVVRLHLVDGSTRRLRLRPASDGTTYAAVADGYPYVVRFNKQRWDRTVLQGRSSLFRE